ncbi:MAG TPA: SRPBCC domain-containing protein, partial [Actinomycetota bacterium]|nr:SRPBCC domain-containing protein [Actinomycetota bacterium]
MTAELELRRDLDAPPVQVWRALTDPAALAAWFWPPRLEPAAEVALAVGGGYRIAGPGAGIAVSGRYLELDPPHRLACTWRWDGEDAETLATVELAASGEGGTALTLGHEGFADDATRDDHVQGWADCLDRLP